MSNFKKLISGFPQAKHRARSILDDSLFLGISFENHPVYTLKIPSDEAPEGHWKCVLKFDESGEDLIEAFCSCPDGECCEHLATANFIMHPEQKPTLPVQFKQSLWTALASIFKGDIQSSSLANESLKITRKTPTHHFAIKAKNNDSYNRLILSIQNPTSTNELLLLFQLMFFEKWIFEFREDETGLPLIVKAESTNYTVDLCISSSDFLSVFAPHLEKISTNLEIFPKKLKMKAARIDLSSQDLIYSWETKPVPAFFSEDSVKPLGDLRYLSGGMILLPMKQEYSISCEDIEKSSPEFKKFLSEHIPFFKEAVPVHYEILISKNTTFHGIPYLFTPRDLTEKGFSINDRLAYIENKGFYKLKSTFGQKPESLFINKDRMEDFLDNYTSSDALLDLKIFNSSAPQELEFGVSPLRQIFFHSREPSLSDPNYVFGKWTFYPEKGFFRNDLNLSRIQSGLIIEPEQLDDFIAENETELKKISGFFFDQKISVNDVHLKIKRDDRNKYLSVKTFIANAALTLFRDYMYIEDHGFHKIPEQLKILCLSVREGKIDYTNTPEFLSLPFIQDHLESDDVYLKKPKHHSLVINQWEKHPGYIKTNFTFKTDLGSISFKEIVNKLKKKKLFLFSNAGFLNLQEEPFYILKSLNMGESSHENNESCFLSITDFLKLDALIPTSLASDIAISPQNKEIYQQLKDFCLPEDVNLSCVKHHLRPYQKNGLLWLWFLYKHGLSGMLCDEMGLGKTHQSVALLDLAARTLKQENKPIYFLIACPTSVVSHWESVIKEYLPNLSLTIFCNTKHIRTISTADIVITSYGTLRRNHVAFLNQRSPNIAVFDEIQIAKNKNSQIHKILARINAHMKLGLTGTPIENNLYEFKNLLEIILPGYIPDPIFKEFFLKQFKDSPKQKDELIKITRPFILKRTKKQVLPNLPDKVNITYPFNLSSEQKQLYSGLLDRKRDALLQDLSEPNTVLPYFHIFSILNQLKQICDHPAVYLKTPGEYKKHASGKWDLFVDVLHQALNENKKIVIFSQYLAMLEIFKLYFEEIGISYASIQGKTRNRKEEIERFRINPDCKIFMGSLLASGVGINLTAGSTVIMYDRWWNPAKENQALDRVHRIGQKNTVFIYKLIAKNTVEERIDSLIQRKLELFRDFIPDADANVIHMLNRDDLITLLSYKEDK
ncbi:MAG: DEAD/DEAH box helicase [Victivallaceae bacterium]